MVEKENEMTTKRITGIASDKISNDSSNRIDLSTKLCGIQFKNPIMGASGTFGYGREFADLYDLNILGSYSLKGITKEPRVGNPTPRIADCEAGMINSIGLQNPGVAAVIREELHFVKEN
ncbi:MAG: hypothetical protein ACRCUS_01135, partial [Anaerovoracaceae bacterium]